LGAATAVGVPARESWGVLVVVGGGDGAAAGGEEVEGEAWAPLRERRVFTIVVVLVSVLVVVEREGLVWA
jgi:hypothetical protein